MGSPMPARKNASLTSFGRMVQSPVKYRAPLTVQKEVMGHAGIQTAMNIYGKAMTDSKRQVHSKVEERS